jgi:hypothetical protein
VDSCGWIGRGNAPRVAICMNPDKESRNVRTQKTDQGLEIPVPKRSEFDAAIEKVAPKEGRKRPAEKGRRPSQSQ